MREGHLAGTEEEEEEEEEEPKEQYEGEDDAADENGERMILKCANEASSIDSQEKETYGAPQSSSIGQGPVDHWPDQRYLPDNVDGRLLDPEGGLHPSKPTR